jgi:hypothetical protein
MTESRVLVAEFFLTVGALWFVYSYLYKRIRLDAFRETLFTVRDDLFDYMWQHNLPYGDRAYGLLRSSLNGMIRAANDGSFNLMTVAIYLRTVEGEQPNKVAEAIAEIHDCEVRERFQAVYNQVGWIGFKHIWLEGPLSFFFAPIMVMAEATKMLKKKGWRQKVTSSTAELGAELDRQQGLQPA